MAQLVKYLLRKREDLSLASQIPSQKPKVLAQLCKARAPIVRWELETGVRAEA